MTDQKKAGDGGDLLLSGGSGGQGPGLLDGAPGNIVFKLPDGTEALRITGTGEFFVRGELVATNIEVYDAFCDWLREVTVEKKA